MKMMFGLATNKPEPNKIPHHQLQSSCLNMIVLTLWSPPLSQILVLIAEAWGQTVWYEQKNILKVHALCTNVTWHLSLKWREWAPQDTRLVNICQQFLLLVPWIFRRIHWTKLTFKYRKYKHPSLGSLQTHIGSHSDTRLLRPFT